MASAALTNRSGPTRRAKNASRSGCGKPNSPAYLWTVRRGRTRSLIGTYGHSERSDGYRSRGPTRARRNSRRGAGIKPGHGPLQTHERVAGRRLGRACAALRGTLRGRRPTKGDDMRLREIKPPADLRPIAGTCQKCGGDMTRGPVPCPDGKPGCLVLHYGYYCHRCGAYFTGEAGGTI